MKKPILDRIFVKPDSPQVSGGLVQPETTGEGLVKATVMDVGTYNPDTKKPPEPKVGGTVWYQNHFATCIDEENKLFVIRESLIEAYDNDKI